MAGGVGTGSARGEGAEGAAIGPAGGGAGAAIAGFGGLEGAAGGRRSSVLFDTAGMSTRDGAATGRGCAAGLGCAVGLGCAEGGGGTGLGGAASLTSDGEPGAGKTSSTLMPGGALASQTMSASTTTWTESEPDMQRPSFNADEPLFIGTGKVSGCPWERGTGLDRAGHRGEAGSLMSLLLSRAPPFAYGLPRVSGSPPAGLTVSARSGGPAGAGLDTGADRSTEAAGKGVTGRPTSALPGGLTVGGGGSGRIDAPAGMISSAGRGSPSAAPAPPAIRRAQARGDARRRPIT
jgi:hypothetical protein